MAPSPFTRPLSSPLRILFSWFPLGFLFSPARGAVLLEFLDWTEIESTALKIFAALVTDWLHSLLN